MKYKNAPMSEAPGRIGLLLVNLGTPDAPEVGAVRRYLREFLWDPRVVEMARLPWWLLLNGIILRTRPARSAAAYRKVWEPSGSPLLTATQQIGHALATALKGPDRDIRVVTAMRYGNPSIAAGLELLDEEGADRVLILPLYPQYSASTTASVYDKVYEIWRGWRKVPEARFVGHYCDQASYIAALAASVRRHQAQHGVPDLLVISFHGIPLRYAEGGDPYPQQCKTTASLLAEALGLKQSEWRLTFQSRFGREEWLQPYTDETLKACGRDGVKHLQVVCPGFSVDCLETLEEIAVENREHFEKSGGERFGYIPALNDAPEHLQALQELAERHLSGWSRSHSVGSPAEGDRSSDALAARGE